MTDEADRPVRATVGEVRAMVDGLRGVVEQGFSDLQRQLNEDATLPERLREAETRLGTAEREIEALKRDAKRRVEWRRGPALLAGVAAVGVIANIILALTQAHP